MPIHEYCCPQCHLVLERYEPHTVWEALERERGAEATAEAPSCPGCKVALVRMISSGHFRLRGAGFHQNDYPKGGSRVDPE